MWRAQPDRKSSVFAVAVESRRLLWARPDANGLRGLTPAPGHRLLASSAAGEMVSLDAADGSRQWSVPVGELSAIRGTDDRHVYLATGAGGVNVLRLADGGTEWTLTPEQGDTWRCLWVVAADDNVLILRDKGELTCNATRSGEQRWSAALPFRLDLRCRPVLVRDTLYVPGGASEGVCAVDIRTGRLRWTFRDSSPGVQVWTLSTDGERLFAGHDTQLNALPLAD
ncbi:PQQ-binding-like beta-propeller repeat protein [Kitasatospora sp. GP82]|uniref:outer membrane protein assembly factor BamB family protein n=1 Tax=Kitasatospora sp. GP82 TaxID=3035089 RepID=UPI002473388E|nr:PQQ-binding-like beta-propeller repeat protein [Kitasatospora sp. GP82]MDH6129909.1 outer membrane protein assembly factor BamB [Kitasatospora sp. GP82]